MNGRNFRIVVLLLLSVAVLTACGQSGGNDEAVPAPTSLPADEAPTAIPEAPEVAESTEVTAEETPAAASDSELVLTPTEEAAAPQNRPPAEGNAEYAYTEEGIASYLSDALHGSVTASGETYDKDTYVAAHKDLPFGTEVRVTSLYNDASVIVTVIDRMPPNNPHLIDVSYVAAVDLDMLASGNIEARAEWNE